MVPFPYFSSPFGAVRLTMATIRKKGPYQWLAQVLAQLTCTFNTQAEANTWATMIEREMDAGMFVSCNEVEFTSFVKALEMYVDYLRIETLPKTLVTAP